MSRYNAKNWNHKPAVQINAALLMLLDQGSTNNGVGWCKLLYDIQALRERKLRQRWNVNRKWSGIRIWISGLILIGIRMFVESLPKCCGCLVGGSHFAQFRKNRQVTDSICAIQMVRNLLKIPYSTMQKSIWKSDQEPTHADPKINHF